MWIAIAFIGGYVLGESGLLRHLGERLAEARSGGNALVPRTMSGGGDGVRRSQDAAAGVG